MAIMSQASPKGAEGAETRESSLRTGRSMAKSPRAPGKQRSFLLGNIVHSMLKNIAESRA